MTMSVESHHGCADTEKKTTLNNSNSSTKNLIPYCKFDLSSLTSLNLGLDSDFAKYVLHILRLRYHNLQTSFAFTLWAAHQRGNRMTCEQPHKLLNWDFGHSWTFHHHQPWKGNQTTLHLHQCYVVSSPDKQKTDEILITASQSLPVLYILDLKARGNSAMHKEHHAK